jgi:glycosyltransferase involved in cell wall biosynthesis
MKISAVILSDGKDPYQNYCLTSVLDIVDDVVLETEPFSDIDFGTLRNKTIENAKGEWILVLDSDEVLSNFDGSPVKRKQLEELIVNAEANGLSGYHIFTLHFMYNYRFIDGRNNGNHFSYARFFKKSDFVRYKYKVHEIPEFKSGQNLATTSNFAIYHFGHCKGMENLREKYRKRMEIKDNPFKIGYKDKTADQYCSEHEIFRMSLPLINYNGPLPGCMKLW